MASLKSRVPPKIMEKDFLLTILCPDKKLYEGRIKSLIVPSELGYLGVLANHAPLITNLVPGKITIRNPSDEITVLHAHGKGFLEVFKNNVTLLVSAA
ncbi:MAG TPA: hypothetical protein DCL49_02675 [Candidatus Omnitrophica bacterium]|nr:hypothetical protein [Candidatus Omnitrophota bacterium]HBG63417.1 hypothetical protein [Candidatus Omnitrophota bacterium]HCD37488.1 hypothetical protein [Candidatus Omnitrophota bacterium]